MEDQVKRLVEKTWKKYEETPASQRLLIAVSGIPGSGTQLSSSVPFPSPPNNSLGKTTLASTIVKHLNAHHSRLKPGCASTPIAAFIPMDGYHLSRAQLSALPDPTTAHARRGAAFTFDGVSFLTLVQKLRKPLCPESSTLYAPSFSHKLKDPVADDIAIHPSSRIIVFEGNYLSLSKKPWKEAAALMDELWFMEVEVALARRRLVERHVRTGVAGNREEAEKRADENDLANGREIVQGRLEVDEVIVSREDEGWKPQAQGE